MNIAETSAQPILEFGRGWMSAPGTAQRAAEMGFEHPFGLWVCGRAGVLGDVTADAAAAAIGFMAPGLVAQLWNSRPDGLSAPECASAYAGAAADWGRQALAGVDAERSQRLADLAVKVAGAADASMGGLFAGWRAMPLPDDPAGAATVALQVLREMRGGAHLSAVHAVGLGPHGSIMSTDDPVRGGAKWATQFGWPEPHPDPDFERRAEAEALTSRACLPAYLAALDDNEQTEFSDLLREAPSCLA